MITIAIIPARGGSKAIPKKNIMDFCGHSLLAWTVAAARGCPAIDRVYVSTDCPEISAVARRYGAEVVRRPDDISGDRATSESALIHACREIEKAGRRPDRVVFLQATSPVRESSELTGALEHFEKAGLDSLFSASVPEDLLVWWEEGGQLKSLNYDFRSRKRRQESEGGGRLLIETGSFYVTKTDLLLETGNRLGGRIGTWIVPVWKSWEIDSADGLALVESLMKIHQLDKNPPVPVNG
ncbi:MAG: acylneuraminate cytidylyltransferase family protein [Verrucomicrobia bacterium]|nr:acylneuraminate cytidylyltransferase family protein [Verrucomicrobiota bacterium]MBU1909270.1 acylneuraminate cytidylyltransferase family protein [Verrucomicrobiota bacterium]